MQTPWGEIRVRDSHVHFFGSSFFRSLSAQKGSGETTAEFCAQLGWETPPESNVELAERWVAELDRHGVESAVLLASLPGEAASVVEAVQAFPSRFSGWSFVNPLAADAVKQAGEALAAGMTGICLLPAMHAFSLADERVEALLQVAERHRAVVFVHLGVLSVGVRKKLGLRSHFELRYSNPVDLHGPALRHPQVRFVVPHFGAGFFREALMVCDLCPNVYLDTSSSNSWVKYQTPPMSLRQVMERALAVVGADRLVFGSDSSFFPRGWQRGVWEEQVRVLEELGVDASAAGKILGGNLAGLLHRG